MVYVLPRLLELLRKLAFAFPFGCLTALTSHQIRFGDDHDFGGSANETIVAAAIGGSVVIALLILHGFLTAGSTTVTGTIARSRVRPLLPGTPLIFGLAALLYYGIELLEGNGLELGVPTLIIAAIGALVAFALRALVGQLARFVVAIVRESIAALSARPLTVAQLAPQRHSPGAQTFLTARRLGRAPPTERRLR